MYYKINHGSITLGNNTILEDINFYIKDNEKIGIVGRNGCGKTTLLKAITGELELNDGYDELKIESSNDFKLGYVKQQVQDNLDITMLEFILDAYKEILDVENKLKELENLMSKKYDEKIINKYNNLLSNYEYIGGYKYKKEYEIAIKKFGFSEEDKSKLLSEFSGGQLTKISLIKLLLSKPDLLILDEPTNHLDISTIEWLEDYLKNYNKNIIIVSHDRMFLDNICNVIYDIEYGTLKRYSGNYSYFIKQKEEDYLRQLKDYEMQQKEIKRLESIADRFRYKPSKASMAMSKLKQIERMVKIDKPNKSNTKTFKVNFNPKVDSYKEVLKVKNLSIGYDSVLSNMTFNVERGDKLGIIGMNGIGKSTLLKTLIGDIKPLGGKYVFGDRTDIGYFSQKLDNLDSENTIYEEIDKTFPSMTPNEIRSLLGSFEFSGDDVFKRIGDLSGGEKVRVSLAKILNSKPNVLIMDEPTNHLDIISKDTIEKLLKSFTGTIIMVSHDRYLIKNVCNKLLVFNQDSVDFYQFGYQEYLEKRVVVEKGIVKEQIKKEQKSSYNDKNNNDKIIKKLEKEIEKLENKINELNNELLKEEIYMDSYKANNIQKEIDSINKNIEEKTKEWEELVD